MIEEEKDDEGKHESLSLDKNFFTFFCLKYYFDSLIRDNWTIEMLLCGWHEVLSWIEFCTTFYIPFLLSSLSIFIMQLLYYFNWLIKLQIINLWFIHLQRKMSRIWNNLNFNLIYLFTQFHSHFIFISSWTRKE